MGSREQTAQRQGCGGGCSGQRGQRLEGGGWWEVGECAALSKQGGGGGGKRGPRHTRGGGERVRRRAVGRLDPPPAGEGAPAPRLPREGRRGVPSAPFPCCTPPLRVRLPLLRWWYSVMASQTAQTNEAGTPPCLKHDVRRSIVLVDGALVKIPALVLNSSAHNCSIAVDVPSGLCPEHWPSEKQLRRPSVVPGQPPLRRHHALYPPPDYPRASPFLHLLLQSPG